MIADDNHHVHKIKISLAKVKLPNILPCRALGGVIIWMEIRFDNGIMQNYLGIESVVNTTDIAESNVSTSVTAVLDLREFERIRYNYITVLFYTYKGMYHVPCYRHYSSLSWIGLVLIILILSCLIFTFAPLCKSQAAVNV